MLHIFTLLLSEEQIPSFKFWKAGGNYDKFRTIIFIYIRTVFFKKKVSSNILAILTQCIKIVGKFTLHILVTLLFTHGGLLPSNLYYDAIWVKSKSANWIGEKNVKWLSLTLQNIIISDYKKIKSVMLKVSSHMFTRCQVISNKILLVI